MSQKIKVGVIGCGTMGLEHVGNLVKSPHCGPENVTVCDPNPSAIAAAQSRFGVRAVENIDALMGDVGIDAVVVAGPNRLHASTAIRALELGKHVLLEKPMALNEADARQVVEASRRSGKILHVGFELRNSLFPRQVKEMKAELGELVSAQVVEYRGHFWPQWKGETADGGSMYLMEACHHIDLFRWWSESEVSEVHAAGSTRNLVPHYQFPDTQFTTLIFENGFVGHISLCHVRSAMPAAFSYADPAGNNDLLEERLGHQYEYSLVGTQGALRYLPLKGLCYRYRHELQPDGSFWQRLDNSNDENAFPDHKSAIHNVAVEIDEFLEAITGGNSAGLDPEDALNTHLVCFAAEKALRGRRPVVMESPRGVQPGFRAQREEVLSAVGDC